MPALSDALVRLYERTQYRVRLARGGCAVIRLHQLLPAPLQAMLPSPDATWMFITACNPRSQPRPVQVNRMRQRQLLARLHQLVPAARLAAGMGVGLENVHGKRWREPSLFAAGITLESTDTLMREFEQHAIVCGTGSEPAALRWNPKP